jgi:uncharacterized RDD family membrane protein YckC
MFRWCYAGRAGRDPLAPLLPGCQTAASRRRLTPGSGYRCSVSNQRAATSSAFYPGQNFGLPEFGSGSVAGWSRRLGALLIDWLACSVIAIAFFYHARAGHAADVLTQPRLWTPVVFGVEDFLLTALTGVTIGKRLLGLRVVRLDGRPVGLWALPRTLLLLLVVPAMIMDRDLRGLQDKAAGTAVVRA